MEHRALFSSVSLWVHQQESGLQILLFIFFLSYRATQGLNRHPPHPPSIAAQLQPFCLSGLHRKQNGLLQGECGHMLSGLNQQAEGKR